MAKGKGARRFNKKRGISLLEFILELSEIAIIIVVTEE